MREVSIAHFTSEDFENVYEPGDDTYVFLDALMDEFSAEQVLSSIYTQEYSWSFLLRNRIWKWNADISAGLDIRPLQ